MANRKQTIQWPTESDKKKTIFNRKLKKAKRTH
jgi:hypothetical protein